MLMAKMSDVSGNVFISFPRELGDSLLGMTAEDFKRFRENNDEDTVKDLFHTRHFKQHCVLVKARQDSFNNSSGFEQEGRMKYFAMKVLPYSLQQENRMLLNRLKLYSDRSEPMEIE